MNKAYYYITFGSLIAVVILSLLLYRSCNAPKPEEAVKLQVVIDSLAKDNDRMRTELAATNSTNEQLKIDHEKQVTDLTAKITAARKKTDDAQRQLKLTNEAMSVVSNEYTDHMNNEVEPILPDTNSLTVVGADSGKAILYMWVDYSALQEERRLVDSLIALQKQSLATKDSLLAIHERAFDIVFKNGFEMQQRFYKASDIIIKMDRKYNNFWHKWALPTAAGIAGGVLGYYTRKAIEP